jgi:uncharacterized protein YkwD
MVRAFLIIVLLLGWFAWTPAPAQANSTSSYCATAEEVKLLNLINDYRAANDLDPLVLTQTLGAAAEHHSIDMADNNYFSHTLSDGTTWSKNMSNHGYTFTTYRAENLAAGSSTANGAFLQWKGSPGHNANMLNPRYKAIGVGQAYNVSSTHDWYWTAVFGGRVDAVACTKPLSSSLLTNP